MVTDERMQFTFSIAAPTASDAAGAARQRRAMRRVVRTMQGLLDQLPPAEVERACSRIDAIVRHNEREPVGAALEQITEGRIDNGPEQVALELRNLERDFRLRRELLAGSLRAPEVALLLGATRQTPHDRVAAGTLLAIRDQGSLRFPPWQFDSQGPHGVVAGLADVLRALPVPPLSQASWLTRPNAQLGGITPLAALQQGKVGPVVRLAEGVGVA